MANLKLGKLPDRMPVKITVALSPDLYRALTEYAAAYSEAYGAEEPLSELVPAILAAYLNDDRAFSRRQKG